MDADADIDVLLTMMMKHDLLIDDRYCEQNFLFFRKCSEDR